VWGLILTFPLSPPLALLFTLSRYPFDSSVKRMAVTYRETSTDKCKAMMKGAVERVLEACVKAQTAEGDVEFTKDFEAQILENMEALASGGLRVLALAHREISESEASNKEIERKDVESNMTFLGLVG